MGFQACINKDINKVEVYLQKPNSSVTPFQLKIKTPLDDVLTAEREQKSLDAVPVLLHLGAMWLNQWTGLRGNRNRKPWVFTIKF
jgi:hypothetical protein